jgi:enoyl-CoA hydratase
VNKLEEFMPFDLHRKWPLGQPPQISFPLPERMDALTILRDHYGAPGKVIKLAEVRLPSIQPEHANRVMVAILATGPNFNTNFAALGLPVPVFGRGDAESVHIPGSDALGIVVDAGPSVKGLKVGQAVILDSWTDRNVIRGYETHDGFNAQFAVVDEHRAFPIPNQLKNKSPEQLAALLLTYGTAYRAVVERLATRPGESVLIMGGGKGTSFAGAQIAKALGAKVILMGSNPTLGQRLIDRGIADRFVDRREIPRTVFGVIPEGEDYKHWHQRTKAFRDIVFAANNGYAVDHIFEHTGGENFPLLVSVLKSKGKIAFFGATGRGLKGEYKESFFYCGRRFVFDARWVWMRQKQILFRKCHPEAIFNEIQLRPGKRGLVWGADAYARKFIQSALERKAEVVVIASRKKEKSGIKRIFDMGVEESSIIDLESFHLPKDMPDPLTNDGRPNSQYATQYMVHARALGNAIWKIWGPKVNPDFIVERADRSTLHFSTFLLRDFSEQEDMPCGYIIAQGGEDLSILGSHMYRSTQARETIWLLEQNKILMEQEDLEIVDLPNLPKIQQKMLDGSMKKPKGVALVQAGAPNKNIQHYENHYLGKTLREANPHKCNYLDIHCCDDIGIVVMKRIDALNALNTDLVGQLASVYNEINDKGTLCGEKVKTLILCSGAKTFAAGADVTCFQNKSAEEIARIAEENLRLFSTIENLKIPTIAVIDGFALGGGNELAMSTHYRIVTENAWLGQPEIKLGIIPGYGGLQRLPRLIGPERAVQLCINGEPINGRRAVSIGLADEFVAASTALYKAFKLAQKFANKDKRFKRMDWDCVSKSQKSLIGNLLGESKIKKLSAVKTPNNETAKNLVNARKYAAKIIIESICYGYKFGFIKGLQNDAQLFGTIAASASGQEWIRRFINKDPLQSSYLMLLEPEKQ